MVIVLCFPQWISVHKHEVHMTLSLPDAAQCLQGVLRISSPLQVDVKEAASALRSCPDRIQIRLTNPCTCNVPDTDNTPA